MDVRKYWACLGTHKQKQLSPGRVTIDRLDLSLPPWIIEESKEDVNADSLCWTQSLWHAISSFELQTFSCVLVLGNGACHGLQGHPARADQRPVDQAW